MSYGERGRGVRGEGRGERESGWSERKRERGSKRREGCECDVSRPSFSTAHLIWLVACLSDLGHYHVHIDPSVHRQVPLHSHQTVLLAVVEPVACAAGTNETLELVGLDPDQLVHSLVAPESEALPAKLHGTAWERAERERERVSERERVFGVGVYL